MEIPKIHERVTRLSDTHLVQQGGELAYLLIHDLDFRHVRREHLRAAGKRVRLKENIRLLSQLLQDFGGCHFSFYVVSAGPQEVVESALEGIVPPKNIFARQVGIQRGGSGQCCHLFAGRVWQGRDSGPSSRTGAG
jgi:hypothetical protein